MSNGLFSRRRTNKNYFASSDVQAEKYASTYLGTHWMTNKYIYEPKELEFLNWKGKITSEYENLVANRPNISDISENSYQYVFTRDTLREYQFFAKYNAPREVFQYVDIDGNIAHLNKEQLNQLVNWDGKNSPFERWEVHHLIPKHTLPNGDPRHISTDNAMPIFDKNTHIKYTHDGNTLNPTPQKYLDAKLTGDDKLNLTIQDHQDYMTLNIGQYGAIVVAGAATTAFTVTAIIEYIRLRNDPRPWKQKQSRILQRAMITVRYATPLAVLGFGTRQIVVDAISNLPAEVADTVFMEVLPYNMAFLVVGLAFNLHKTYKQINNNQKKSIAIKELKSKAVIVGGEFIAFSSLGLLLGGLSDVLLAFAVPDPTFIWIITRVSYSTGKVVHTAKKNKHEKNAAIKIKELRQAHFHSEAMSALT